MNRPWVRWVLILCAAFPALLPLWLVLGHGVDLPYWDQWEGHIAGLYVKAADGTLSLWDFTAPHNEHRMFVPRVMTFLLNLMTGYNTVGEMLLTWAIVGGTSLCVLWLIRQTSESGAIDGQTLLLWFLCNLMLFSVSQQENWLWGIGPMNVLPPGLLVAAMAVLYTRWSEPIRVGASIVLCAGSMFSSGQGILAFPLVGVLVGWSSSWKELKSKKVVLLAWVGAFALCLLMFAWGYKLPKLAPGLENKAVSLWERIVYLFTFLGNQYIFVRSLRWETASVVAGSVSLALYLWAVGHFVYLIVRPKETRLVGRMLPWMLIGGYALLSAGIAAVFRTNVGLENAISSRYVTVSLYLQVALISLIPMICKDLRSRLPALEPFWGHTPTILASALATAWLFVLPASWHAGVLSSLNRRQAKAALLLINVLPENTALAKNVFPRVDELKATANRLDALGYLRPRLLTTTVADQLRDPRFDNQQILRLGAFERIVETTPGNYAASGWAIKHNAILPADVIMLAGTDENQQDKVFIYSAGVFLRPDLVKAFGDDERYEMVGWSIRFGTRLSPEQLEKVEFSAWAFDSETGKLRPLPGRHRVYRQQQQPALVQ